MHGKDHCLEMKCDFHTEVNLIIYLRSPLADHQGPSRRAVTMLCQPPSSLANQGRTPVALQRLQIYYSGSMASTMCPDNHTRVSATNYTFSQGRYPHGLFIYTSSGEPYSYLPQLLLLLHNSNSPTLTPSPPES